MARNLARRWKAPPGWHMKDGCTILGCGRPGIARGLCWPHYARARRGAAVLVYLCPSSGVRGVTRHFGPERPPRSFLRMNRIRWELEENVTWEPNTGCALWLGEYNSGNGRAVIGNCRDPWGYWAARAVLYFRGVKLAERGNHKMHARHVCNNGACVNPDHIRYGTAQENMADRSLRYARGELDSSKIGGPHGSRLAPRLIAYIREAHALGLSKAELARDLGLHWQTIDRAIREAPSRHQPTAQAA